MAYVYWPVCRKNDRLRVNQTEKKSTFFLPRLLFAEASEPIQEENKNDFIHATIHLN